MRVAGIRPSFGVGRQQALALPTPVFARALYTCRIAETPPLRANKLWPKKGVSALTKTMKSPYRFSWVKPVRVIAGISGRHFRSGRCVCSRTSPAGCQYGVSPDRDKRQRKMQDKQGRDAASVPVMPEAAVHCDGGLRRPVLWKGRRRPTEMQAAKTCRNDVLSVFSEGSSATPPPPIFVV